MEMAFCPLTLKKERLPHPLPTSRVTAQRAFVITASPTEMVNCP